MKPITIQSILAAAALLAPGALFAQTSATTIPVGYVTLGNTDPGVAGGASIPGGSDTYISIPLDRPDVYTGSVTNVDSAIVSVAGTPFAALNLTTLPHLVKVETGTLSGQYALISSKTDSTVTVAASALISGLQVGDMVSIRPAWTISHLFSGVTLPAVGLQVFAFDGTEAGVNIQANNSWAWDGTNWNNNISLEIDDNAVLYPGEALIIRNESVTNVASFVVNGEVFTSNARQTFVGAVSKQDNPFGFQSSAGEPINTSGVTAVAEPGDSILVVPNNLVTLNKAASKTYDFDGTGWVDSELLDYIDNTVLFQAGAAYFYRREAGEATVNISNTPDYVPSL